MMKLLRLWNIDSDLRTLRAKIDSLLERRQKALEEEVTRLRERRR